MKLLSDYYKSVLVKEHEITPWGVASLKYTQVVYNMMQQYNLKEILDYGSGVGNLGISLNKLDKDIKIYNYEPGKIEWSITPQPCAMVACIDVIEHVEPEYLDAVLDDLERVIIGYAFVDIFTKPAARILHNGWNAHICLKTSKEWFDIFSKRFDIIDARLYQDTVELKIAKKGFYENK